jgi:Major Facilitator Superfamily
VRATPTILIDPLDEEFGWRVDQVSLAISINLVLFGLMAPFSAALMEQFGMRRVVAAALAATAAGTAATIGMSALWQLTLLWGVVIGAATGCLSSPLAAVVATRWFVERRGLVTGVLSAAYATGQLIFLPVLAVLVRDPVGELPHGLPEVLGPAFLGRVVCSGLRRLSDGGDDGDGDRQRDERTAPHTVPSVGNGAPCTRSSRGGWRGQAGDGSRPPPAPQVPTRPGAKAQNLLRAEIGPGRSGLP